METKTGKNFFSSNSSASSSPISLLPLVLALVLFEVLLSGHGQIAAQENTSCTVIRSQFDSELEQLMNYRTVALNNLISQANGYKMIEREVLRLRSEGTSGVSTEEIDLIPQAFVDTLSALKNNAQVALESQNSFERRTIAQREQYWKRVKSCLKF